MSRKQEGNRLVVGDKEWAKDLPKWLLKEVESERMMLGMGGIMTGEPSQVGDAEVAVYLFTASLRQPLSHEDVEVYMYLTTRLAKKTGREIPDDIRKEKLGKYEEYHLEELKRMIYTKRGGEIQHPLLSVLREMKKAYKKKREVR